MKINNNRKRCRRSQASDLDGKLSLQAKEAASTPDDRSPRIGPPILISRWGTTLLLGLATILLFLIYSGSFKGPLIFDSSSNILSNSSIQIEELSLEELRDVFTGAHNRRRPVTNLSLAINYYFSGNQARGYRIVNVLIHLITGILFYLLIRRTLETPALSERELPRTEIAFFAACSGSSILSLFSQSLTWFSA